MEVTQWLALLQPFIAVEILYICGELAPHIAPALQAFYRDGEAEILLALKYLLLSDQLSKPIENAIMGFRSGRQLSGRTIVIQQGSMNRRGAWWWGWR